MVGWGESARSSALLGLRAHGARSGGVSFPLPGPVPVVLITKGSPVSNDATPETPPAAGWRFPFKPSELAFAMTRPLEEAQPDDEETKP